MCIFIYMVDATQVQLLGLRTGMKRPKWTQATVTSQQKGIVGAQNSGSLSSVLASPLPQRWMHAVTLRIDVFAPLFSHLNFPPLFQYSRVYIVLISRKFPAARLWQHFTLIATLAYISDEKALLIAANTVSHNMLAYRTLAEAEWRQHTQEREFNSILVPEIPKNSIAFLQWMFLSLLKT
jgi:hypothetical protein